MQISSVVTSALDQNDPYDSQETLRCHSTIGIDMRDFVHNLEAVNTCPRSNHSNNQAKGQGGDTTREWC